MRPGRIPEEEAGGGGVAGAAMGAAGGAGTARAKRRRSSRSARTLSSSQHASLTPASSPFPGQHAVLPTRVWHPIWRVKGCPAYTETRGRAASVLMPSKYSYLLLRFQVEPSELLCPAGTSGPGFQSDKGGEGWQVHELQVSLVSQIQLAKSSSLSFSNPTLGHLIYISRFTQSMFYSCARAELWW